MKNIFFSPGCNDDCGSDSQNSYLNNLKGSQGPKGQKGDQGTPGKNNLIVGSQTDGTTDVNSTDDAIGGTTIADLTALGFNPTAKPTLKATVDSTDTTNIKVFVRNSNSWLNFITTKLKSGLLNAGTAVGQILQWDGASWSASIPGYEKYNCTTTTSYGYNLASIGQNQPFTVPALMSYKFKHVVAIVDPTNAGNYIEGTVISYSGLSLTINIKNIKGTGNTNNWSVMLTAPDYLPFIGDPANYGKYFYNNSGAIEMRINGIFTGMTMPWHNVNPPAGFLPCNGVLFTQSALPDLYNHLVPPGSLSSKYLSDVFGVPLSSGFARTPNYNNGAVPYGVDGATILPGTRFGANSFTLGASQMPVASPYQLLDPGHGHIFLDGEDNNASGGGWITSSGNANGGIVYPTVAGAGIQKSTTGITVKNNNIIGGQTADGGLPIDMRQLSEGCIYIIKT